MEITRPTVMEINVDDFLYNIDILLDNHLNIFY